jgi:Xaa-Pro aminopeptidase
VITNNFVGHGLGSPARYRIFRHYHQQELQAGMVLAIEPMFFNGEGYQLEDILIVTADGAS